MRNPVLRAIVWIICGLLFIIVVAVVVWILFVVWGPDWIKTHDVGSAGGMLGLEARDDARGRLLTLGAGLLATAALFFTARTYWLTRQTALNEQYSAIAKQIGDRQAAVRVAGLQAMARLADDWKANQQSCIDVLCAYLRMNGQLAPGRAGTEDQERQARAIVIRLIAEHLRIPNASRGWQGRYFDFTGVIFDVGDFDDAVFKADWVRFDHAVFEGKFSFNRVRFIGHHVRFANAKFTGDDISFDDAQFSGDDITFDSAQFTGTVRFDNAHFTSGNTSFDRSQFLGTASFNRAHFEGGNLSFYLTNFAGNVSFDRAEFTHGKIGFNGGHFVGNVRFNGAKFNGSEVYFKQAGFRAGIVSFARFSDDTGTVSDAEFSDGTVNFSYADFSGSRVSFDHARFSGSRVNLDHAQFTDGVVDFRQVAAPPQQQNEILPVPPAALPQQVLMLPARWQVPLIESARD
jgi:Pentapeptide repeats (9 copies)